MDAQGMMPRADSAYAQSANVNEAVVRQIEFYLGRANLPTDYYLLQQMDQEYWVQVETLARFPRLLRFGLTVERIAQLVDELSKDLEVDRVRKLVRPRYIVNEKRRSALILRDVPENTTEEQLMDLFQDEKCPTPASIRPDVVNVWFVNFNGSGDAKTCLEFIQDKQVNGSPVHARVKNIITVPLDVAPIPVPLPPMAPTTFPTTAATAASVDQFRGNGFKARARRPVNAAARKGRRRSLTKHKPDGSPIGEEIQEEVSTIDEELMASGEHFPPLNNLTNTTNATSNTSNLSAKKDTLSNSSQATSESDERAAEVVAGDALVPPSTNVNTDAKVETTAEANSNAPETPMEPSVSAPKSYAAILRTKSAPPPKEEEKIVPTRKTAKKQEVHPARTPNQHAGDDKSQQRDGLVKHKSRPNRKPATTHTKQVAVTTATAKEESLKVDPVPQKVNPVAQQSASVWQNKPRAVLEAPQLRCVEKQTENALKVESTPPMVQSS